MTISPSPSVSRSRLRQPLAPDRLEGFSLSGALGLGRDTGARHRLAGPRLAALLVGGFLGTRLGSLPSAGALWVPTYRYRNSHSRVDATVR